MKAKPMFVLALALGIPGMHCLGASSSSADYSIAADTLDTAGTTLGSVDYSAVSSVGNISGISTEATSGYLLKNGFAGQIYNVAGVIPTATATSVNEGATQQLGVTQLSHSYRP